MSTPVPTPYNAAASYRNFGQELLRMIQSGQITPERANQLKANVYEATRLGNTAQGQQAMNAAIGAARDALPMKGYDPAAMYRNISSQLSNAVKSGQMTVQQAQALQAPLFAATKLGNTAPGYAQMNSAYNNAISAIRNASPAQPQGGLTQAQQPQEVVRPPYVTPQGVGGMELPVANTGGNIAPRTVPHDYDPASQYRDFGQQLLGLIKSGAMTVEQANALKAPVFNAVKLGNSAEGYQQMQNALGAASQPIRNALVAGGQQMGGQNMGITVKPVQPQEIVVTGQRMPEIVAPPPPPMPVMPPQGVGMAPQMPMPPQAAVAQPASAPQGMAMGGLLRKYYGGGMC